MTSTHLQIAIAEMIGTFALVFFGCGAIVIDGNHNGILGIVGIAFAFGLTVLAVVYAVGHVSGAHINPAVTIALASTGKFSWRGVPLHVVAQLVGASLGALVLKYTLAHGNMLGMTLPSISLGKAFLVEAVLTAFLMFVVMGAATDPRASTQFAAVAIAAVIIVDILVGGAVTGGSMNPARSFGPALVMMRFQHLWLYCTAPVVGALIGAFLYLACGRIKK